MSREDDCIWTFKALKRGDCPLLLSQECVDSLLQWLCGRRHGSAESPRRILGEPAADKDLVQRVYQALDASLFIDNNLRPIHGSVSERKRRYQLLVSAFHPDRFPELESWLISRSQAVNVAYASFRDNPEAEQPAESSTGARSARTRQRPNREAIYQPGMGEWFMRLIAPLSRSRYLPQKIMAAITILCTLLLALIYLANYPPV